MKRNILGFFAVVLAIAISSFTVKKTTTFYFEYKGTGSHTSMGSFEDPVSSLNPEIGDNSLAWIAITDQDDNVTATEFTDAVNALDRTSPKNGSLNDSEDTEGTISDYQLERKL
jgi:hypothetical protein